MDFIVVPFWTFIKPFLIQNQSTEKLRLRFASACPVCLVLLTTDQQVHPNRPLHGLDMMMDVSVCFVPKQG